MVIDSYNSQKIKILNLVLITMVVFIHSSYNEALLYPYANSIQKICAGYGLASVANVLFFFISGFLFFCGINSHVSCLPKIKNRIKSLFIPYVLWNCIFILWYALLFFSPSLNRFVNINVIDTLLSGSFVDNIKIIFWNPVNFPLWFLRDLMIMVSLSPFLYYIIKYLRWLAPIPFLLLPDEHLMSSFFVLGGCVAMFSSLASFSRMLNRRIAFVALIIYLSLSISQIWIIEESRYLGAFNGLCGCVVLWKGYDRIVNNHPMLPSNPILQKYLGYSFFIFLFHEPVFNIIKKLGLKLLGIHEWSLILLYFINPFIMCLLAIGVAKVLQRYIPKVYYVLVGGRK